MDFNGCDDITELIDSFLDYRDLAALELVCSETRYGYFFIQPSIAVILK